MRARLSYNGENLIITGETRKRWEVLRNFILREDQEDGAIFRLIYFNGPGIEGEGIVNPESDNPLETVASFATDLYGDEGVIVIKKDLITHWIEDFYYGESRIIFGLEEELKPAEKRLIDQLVESKRKAEEFWERVRK